MAIPHQSNAGTPSSLNYYQWLGLHTFEENPERIHGALREMQLRLALADGHALETERARRQLKIAATILLTPTRKAEYDSSLDLNLRPVERYELPPFPDPNQVSGPPPFTSVGATIHPPVASRPARKRKSTDQIRWIGLAGVFLFLVGIGIASTISWSSSGGSAELAGLDPDITTLKIDEIPSQSVPADLEAKAGEESPIGPDASQPAQMKEDGRSNSIEVGNLEQDSPNAYDPFSAPATVLPDVNILAELDLPPLPTPESPSLETVELGQINQAALENLSMRIDSGACNLESDSRFNVSRRKSDSPNSPSWLVTVETGESSSKAIGIPADYRPVAEPVGRFFINSALQLHFQWNPSASYPARIQLRNARLLISVADSTHVVALRKPIRHQGHMVSLMEKVDQDSFLIPNLPADENIFLELTQMDNVAQPIAFEPNTRRAKVNESLTIVIGAEDDTVKAQFRVALRPVNGDLAFSVTPRYLHNGRWDELSDRSVASTVTRVQRSIYDGKREAEQSAKAIPALTRQLQKLQRRVPATLEEAAAINRAIGQTNSELKSYYSKLKRRSSQVPASYAALASLYRVVALGKSLDQVAHIRYRVFAIGSTGEINLLVADATPPSSSTSTGFELPNKYSSPIGDWILSLKSPVRYKFLAGGTFQARDFTTDKVTASGSWSQKGDQITLEAQGRQLVYEMRDGVEMKNEDGIDLFRQLDPP